MEYIWKPPDYKIEVTSRAIVIRLYSPLCRKPTTSVTIERTLVTFNCFPFIVQFQIPEIFVDSTVEEEKDVILGYYSVKFVRNNMEFFNCASVFRNIAKSVRGVREIGTAQYPVEIYPVAAKFYGFMNKYHDRFGFDMTRFQDVIDLRDPDATSVRMRRNLREIDEDISFSPHQYINDLNLRVFLPNIFSSLPPWCFPQWTGPLTQEEQSVLWRTRSYDTGVCRASINNWNLAEIQLLDVLLAFCYSKRVFGNEYPSERAWTISKLASTLSWFEVHNDMECMVRVFYTRSLIYPVHPNWELTQLVHHDLVTLLRAGNTAVLRALIEIRALFHQTRTYFIFNMLFICDMIHFTKYIPNEKLAEFSWWLSNIVIEKHSVRDCLVFLETTASQLEYTGYLQIPPPSLAQIP